MAFEDAVEHERYLDRILSFSPAQQRAYKAVQLMLCAVGAVSVANSCQAHWNLEEAHRFFQIFAKEMGWRGRYFNTSGKYSRAVALYYNQESNKPGSFTFITPWIHHSHAKWRVDDSPDKERLLAAARTVGRAWLPAWKW